MIGLAAFAFAASAAAASAQNNALVEQGRAKFQRTCAPCHGAGPGDDGRAMLPGTDALRIKYRGSKPALLEERDDLPTPVLRVFVRHGVWSMPGFRPTEVTDQEIDAIAAYLADSAKRAKGAAGR